LELAPHVREDVKVRLVVGDQDDVAPPAYSIAYADLLSARGVDAEVTIAPGLGHNIMFTPVVFDELERLLGDL
jgi:predicted esterase